MNYSILIKPLTTRTWTAKEFSALHVLEHLLAFSRSDTRDEYFDSAALDWCEFMGTIRKNAILLETSTLPSNKIKLQEMLDIAFCTKPNWDLFDVAIQAVIEEIEDRTVDVITMIELQNTNMSGHYKYKSSGNFKDITTITLQDVQEVYNIFSQLTVFKLDSNKTKLKIKDQIIPTYKQKTVFKQNKQCLVIQYYSDAYFNVSRQRELEEHLLNKLGKNVQTTIETLPKLSVVTVFLPKVEFKLIKSNVDLVQSIVQKLENTKLTKKMQAFETDYLMREDRINLLDQWDKVVFGINN